MRVAYRHLFQGVSQQTLADEGWGTRKTIRSWCKNPDIVRRAKAMRANLVDDDCDQTEPAPDDAADQAEPAAPVLKFAAPGKGLVTKAQKKKLIESIEAGLVIRLALQRCRLDPGVYDRWREMAKGGDLEARRLLLDISEAEGECAFSMIEQVRVGGGGGRGAMILLARLHRQFYGEQANEEDDDEDDLDVYTNDYLQSLNLKR